MGNFASSMQQVTNFEDDKMLSLMSKLSQTFKLNKDEIQQLVPVLLDFTEANKATVMSVESAFDLMGRALNSHTDMLGCYGLELDATRIKTEGVSYLVARIVFRIIISSRIHLDYLHGRSQFQCLILRCLLGAIHVLLAYFNLLLRLFV